MVKIHYEGSPNGKVLVVGFQGLGLVGHLTVEYLIERLQCKRVGYVETTYVPPLASIRKGDLKFPYEIYEGEGIILVKLEGLPVDRGGASVLRSLVKWAKKEGVQRIIAIGGLNVSFKEGERDVVRYVVNPAYLERYGSLDPPVQEGVQIVGPLALVLNYATIHDVAALAILAYANPDRPDPKGAANAVKCLSDLLGLKVDVKELLDRASKIEEELSKSAVPKLETRKEPGMYA